MDIHEELEVLAETGDDSHLSGWRRWKLKRHGLYEVIGEGFPGRCILTEKGDRVRQGDDWLLPDDRLFQLAGSASVMFGAAVFGGQSNRWWHQAFVMPAYRLSARLSRLAWRFRHRWVPRHRYDIVRTGLPHGYHDVDVLMLNACFALLRRYVEDEIGGEKALEDRVRGLTEFPDPNAPEGFMEASAADEAEALLLYRWWTRDLPALVKRRNDLSGSLYGGGNRRMTFVREGDGEKISSVVIRPFEGDEIALGEELETVEKRIDLEEQEMLHRLVSIRRMLWI